MNTLKKGIVLIIAICIANFVSQLVLAMNYLQLAALFAGIVFLFFLPVNIKYYLFSLTAFYPFMVRGAIGPLPNPDWIWMIAPPLCFIYGAELLMERKPLFSRKSALFFMAVGVLALWSVLNYIKNPVLGQQLTGASQEQGGLRSYFIIFVGITVFLYSYLFFRFKQIDVRKWFIVLLVISLALGIARLITFFENTYIPFLGGTFKYTTIRSVSKVSALRIGGLSDVAIVGIAIILSLTHGRKWTVPHILVFIMSLSLLVLSGGRGSFLGAMFAIIIYIIMAKRRYVIPFAVCLFLLFGIYVLSDFSLEESRFTRFSHISEEAIEREQGRLATYLYAINIFLENPILGKGIGFKEEENIQVRNWNDFFLKRHITEQLTTGGHGAYMSIMMLYGIGGIFFLTVMLFGGIHSAYNMIQSTTLSKGERQLVIFAFIHLLFFTIEFIPSGNGYGTMRLWFLTGMIAGLKSREAGEFETE